MGRIVFASACLLLIGTVAWLFLREEQQNPEPDKQVENETLALIENQLTELQRRVSILEKEVKTVVINDEFYDSLVSHIDTPDDDPATVDPGSVTLGLSELVMKTERIDGPRQNGIAVRYAQDYPDPSVGHNEYLALENAFSRSESGNATLESIDCKTTLCRMVFTEEGESPYLNSSLDIDLPVAISDEIGRDVTVYHQNLGSNRRALYIEVE